METEQPKKRAKRYFSSDDKLDCYVRWKASGLTKNKFCKKNDLVLSAFNKWCRGLDSKHSNNNQNWMPVLPKESHVPEPPNENFIVVLKMPKMTNILLIFLLSILFARGVLDAIAIVR